MNTDAPLRFPDDEWTRQLVAAALREDIGSGDVTTSVAVAPDTFARGRLVARSDGIVAGLPLLDLVYAGIGDATTCELLVADGSAVGAGDEVARLHGRAADLLVGERCALNFLQHLSGIATLTGRYVAEVAGTDCLILDTRKTLPGYRALAKYAVRAGGGTNHRFGLYDRVMLKDNHWAAGGRGIGRLVSNARAAHPQLMIEVEVDTLDQLDEVLPLGVEWILLDNFGARDLAEAVRRRDAAGLRAACRLEASGNVTLETVAACAAAGVDAVSIGRLTHSAPSLDIGLDLEVDAPGGAGDSG